VPENVRLQVFLTGANQQPQQPVGDDLAEMDSLAGYLVDGNFTVCLLSFPGNRGRKQLSQEIIDRLEQDHIQPLLCREPSALLSPSEYPLEDEHGEYDPEQVFG
jgi:hypothetical protein